VSLRKFNGQQGRHMVFEAELLGDSLAVENGKGERQVWSLTNGGRQSAAMCTIAIEGLSREILSGAFPNRSQQCGAKHPSIKIRVRWMPGHEGIQGNERR